MVNLVKKVDAMKEYNKIATIYYKTEKSARKSTLVNRFNANLDTLANIIVYSVLNKCIDPQRKHMSHLNHETGNNDCTISSVMLSLKYDIVMTNAFLRDITNLQNSISIEHSFDKNGDECYKITNPELLSEIDEKTRVYYENYRNFDGYSLKQDTIVSIITYSKECFEKYGHVDLTKDIIIHRLSRKVYIQSEKSAKYADIETTYIQEVFREISRSIRNNSNVQISNQKYAYIEFSELNNSENDMYDKAYIRMPSRYDMGEFVTDMNGKSTYYTINDNESLDKIDNIIAQLHLTQKQSQILDLRLKGYGYKTISTYLGVKNDTIKSQIKEIRRKAEKIGFTPDKFNLKE